MTVSRVAQVHRAVAASSDPKGQNFVVIQVRRLFLLVNLNLLKPFIAFGVRKSSNNINIINVCQSLNRQIGTECKNTL